ncbi:MAG: amino acid deaminase/aldolase [Actinomycetes bacterium]
MRMARRGVAVRTGLPERLDRATRHLEPPFAVVDRAAVHRNADDLVRRAGGLPVRVASKSVRSRSVMSDVLARKGFSGVMAYSVAEALWLARTGEREVLVAYPSTDRTSLQELRRDERAALAVTVMVDDVAQVDLAAGDGAGAEIKVCIDVDASLRMGPVHLGVRRSPLRSGAEVIRLAGEVARRPGVRLVGLMFYDAQVAGLPDSSPAVRWVKKRSVADLVRRRTEVVDAVRRLVDLEIVNGGGTGSLHRWQQDPTLTELTAGSGLYGPTLSDGYDDFRPQPAAFFVLPVVRRPSSRVATVFGGGYVASGPAGSSRMPRPWWPEGLSLLRAEGAGEVQTPLRGRAAEGLTIGDRVWFRHAKAGELCERFDVLYVVDDDGSVEAVPTYRGEGKAFG